MHLGCLWDVLLLGGPWHGRHRRASCREGGKCQCPEQGKLMAQCTHRQLVDRSAPVIFRCTSTRPLGLAVHLHAVVHALTRRAAFCLRQVGNTALALASFKGHTEVMTYLMQEGANAGAAAYPILTYARSIDLQRI